MKTSQIAGDVESILDAIQQATPPAILEAWPIDVEGIKERAGRDPLVRAWIRLTMHLFIRKNEQQH
jgi:hypothetical protein